MMLTLGRQTVRSSWRGYLGAFVALLFGVVLIAVTVTLIGSVDATGSRPGVTADQRAQLDDLAAMFGIMSAVSAFMALFVVSSTFGFVVAGRRRELGLLRLVGATPGQVRRLLLGESLVVAAAATTVGGLLGTALAPAVLGLVEAIGITTLDLRAPRPWIAWAVAVPTGAVIALLGVWRSSRRAARIAPSAAMREAAIERTRPSILQLAVATLCFGGLVVVVVVAADMPPLFALIASILLPEVVVVGLMSIGHAVIPRLAALLARPFVARDVTARMARDEVRAAARTTAAVAAPVVAISAIAGSLLLSLSFTADWTNAQDRARLRAPLVVEADSPAAAAAVASDKAVAIADVRRQGMLQRDEEGRPGVRSEVEILDPVTASAARGLTATRGTFDDFHGRVVAVTATGVIDAGVGLGGTLPVWIAGERVPLRVVAVIPDAPDLYGDAVIPAGLLPPASERATGTVFVLPRADAAAARVSLQRTLAGTDSRILGSGDWIDATTAQTRQANNLSLTILLGPAGLYAAIAIVNATLIGGSQRRRQRDLVQFLGATPDQVRRAAIWQAALVGGTGLLLGGATTLLLGWLVRRAITADLVGIAVPITIPWLPLLGIGVTCVLLTVAAAAAGIRTRKAPHLAGNAP
ncbi:FtsX-like permease family protein [Micromonospora sp. NBC_00362]|uniref:FtsX-like permease family protein n=1 Tax=Micromonospora sp. NBC_00362 TaxID=2975975 RepID=UPI0022558425|nr:FtsX-like permease family protein [Micromonospora sp. NBC_00362]MCX5119832.1 FtsX-like permease family protein [Micromonospora sp. NBC_00362]